MLETRVGAQTDAGRVRRHNEDAYGFREAADGDDRGRGALYVVADGMGGHAAGEVASRLAVETILQTYWQDDAPPAESLKSAIEAANLQIRLQAEATTEQAGMGTTCVCALVREDELVLAHVGDSRAYLLRGGQLQQLTRDHTWVQEQLDQQLIDSKAASQHPLRNILTQALGGPSVRVEITQHTLQPGDILLLCSDGLSGPLDDATIARTLAVRSDPTEASAELVRLANEAGGPDNITALVLTVLGAPVPPEEAPVQPDRPSGFGSRQVPGPLAVMAGTAFLIVITLVANLALGVPIGQAPSPETPRNTAPVEYATPTPAPTEVAPTATPSRAAPTATATQAAPTTTPEPTETEPPEPAE